MNVFEVFNDGCPQDGHTADPWTMLGLEALVHPYPALCNQKPSCRLIIGPPYLKTMFFFF